MIEREENLVRLLRQMKDQGYTHGFVVSDVELNIFGDVVGLFGQNFHLIGHNRESFSRFPGPRGLNGCV